jgi:hypothetical protein
MTAEELEKFVKKTQMRGWTKSALMMHGVYGDWDREPKPVSWWEKKAHVGVVVINELKGMGFVSDE